MNETAKNVEEVLALLRSRGARATGPRRAVIEALLDAGDNHHVTADELAERVQARHPEVHRATVYRTLDALQQVDVITHVHLGHGPSTYHLTRLAGRPHHHAVCRSCSSVIELPVDVLDGVAAKLRTEHGFELAPQHFALSGLCRDCAQRARH